MKKGFTLVEILAIITLLGIIIIITLPAIMDRLEINQGKISEALSKTIYAATDLYIDYNPKKFNDNGTHYIKFETLVNADLLDQSILKDNPNSCVKATYQLNKYNYEIVTSCTEG